MTICILVISHFGFEGGTLVLSATIPYNCLPVKVYIRDLEIPPSAAVSCVVLGSSDRTATVQHDLKLVHVSMSQLNTKDDRFGD